MSYPKNFPGDGGIQLGIIGGGDITDPQESQACGQKVWSPLEHKDGDVELDHLAFSPMMHSPTGFSQQSFHGAMDPGSLVYVMKTMGQNQVQILGQANDLLNFGGGQSGSMGGQGGGQSLMSSKTVQKLMNREIKVLVPPQIKEGESRGAKVRRIKEKGKQHKHALLNGLPSNGALFDLSGWKIPQLNDVPTAKQHYQDIQTNDMLGMLPGEMMSLGGMMQGLMSSIGSTGGAGGGGGMGGGASAGGGAGGYQTKTPYSMVNNVPNSQVAVQGVTSSSVVSVSNGSTAAANTTATNTTPTLEASVSFLGDNTSFSTTGAVNTFNPDATTYTNTSSLVETVGSTTTTSTTTTSTTTAIQSGEYDTNYLGEELKLGKGIIRYVARKFDQELKSRVNVDVAKTVTQEQVDASTQQASNNFSESTTTTTTKTETLQTLVQNFEGTYAQYYGANSDITRMDIIMNTLKPELQDAVNSLSLLVQGMESGGTGSFLTANRVHLETYLDNACDLFCQVNSVTDLMSALKRLQHDEKLFGLDKLEQLTVAQNTAWGMANTHIAANGDLITVYSNTQLQAQAASLQEMLSITNSPSVTGMANPNASSANTTNANNRIVSTTVPSPGKGGFQPSQQSGGGGKGGGQGGNMFGKHAETLMDMFKRMPQDHEKDANKLHKNLNQGQDHTKLWKIVEKTLKGGNPIDVQNLKN